VLTFLSTSLSRYLSSQSVLQSQNIVASIDFYPVIDCGGRFSPVVAAHVGLAGGAFLRACPAGTSTVFVSACVAFSDDWLAVVAAGLVSVSAFTVLSGPLIQLGGKTVPIMPSSDSAVHNSPPVPSPDVAKSKLSGQSNFVINFVTVENIPPCQAFKGDFKKKKESEVNHLV